MLPIESSIAGPVAESHDLLVGSGVSINAQTILPIRHFLVGVAEIEPGEIRIVRSHPAALDQCRRLLVSLPQAVAIAAGTTADAAAQVAADADPTAVAIASERAAVLNGLVVLAADVGDHPEAFTRFVSISTRTRLDRGENWRIAFSFQTDHRPGALHRAIEPFARHALDLVQLTSRPIPQTPWRYRFDAVVSGHPLDESSGRRSPRCGRSRSSSRSSARTPPDVSPDGLRRRRPARRFQRGSSQRIRSGSTPRAAARSSVSRWKRTMSTTGCRVGTSVTSQPSARQRGDRVGGARGGAALTLEHEAADGLVDRGQVAVQELLQPVRLGGEVRALP